MKTFIKKIMILALLFTMVVGLYKKINNLLKEKEKKTNKFKKYYNILNQWLYNKNQGIEISEYFIKKGYNNIAIYGMGELGSRLYEELKGSLINITYAIDKVAYSKYSEIKIVEASQDLDEVDVIVVTPIFDYESIKETLEEKTDNTIISLEDIFMN